MNNDKSYIFQLFGSKIELDELSIVNAKSSENNKKIEDFASLLVPVIRINDYILKSNEILSVEIDCTGFLPKIILKAVFSKPTFYSNNFVKDGDLISLAIRPKSDQLKIIRNDYIITNAYCDDMYTESDDTDLYNTPYIITFFGELFIPGLESSKGDMSCLGTSYDAMQYIANELKLGFASNETGSDDKQVWLDYNLTPREHIENICKHSWKDDNSYFDVWIDIYYNLNFVNINKMLLSPEDEIDYGAYLNNSDMEFLTNENKNESKFPKAFTNMEVTKKNSFYIHSWSIQNESSEITYKIGSTLYGNLFEHNDKLYANKSNTYWELKNEPIYDSDKLKSHIILRGRTKFDKNNNVNGLGRANYNFPEMYEKNPWLGIQYTCSDTSKTPFNWDGNTHKNYLRAITHNVINLMELKKLNITINVIGTNQNIIIGDKVPVLLFHKKNSDADATNQSQQDTEKLNLFYSGWYYVSGYTLKWSAELEEDIMSNFSQSFVLTRREWPMPVPSLPINK